MKINWKHPALIITFSVLNPFAITALVLLYLTYRLPPVPPGNFPHDRYFDVLQIFPAPAQNIYFCLRILPGMVALWWLPIKSKAILALLSAAYIVVVLVLFMFVDVEIFCAVFRSCI